MNLIEEYLSNIKTMKLGLDDYADKRKVKKSNKLADRNREIAKIIDNDESWIKLQYIRLLESNDVDVRNWVAHHVIEIMTFDQPTRKRALNIIKDEAENNSDSLVRLGTSMWLKQYYKNHPDEFES